MIIKNRHKYKLKYSNITSIKFSKSIFPQDISLKCIITKGTMNDTEFSQIIKMLKKYRVLSWKEEYKPKGIIYDGMIWGITITFEDGRQFNSHGENAYPLFFNQIDNLFEPYMVSVKW